MSCCDRGIILIESALALSFAIGFVVMLSGSLQKLSLFQEIDTIVEKEIIDYQVVSQDVLPEVALRKLISTLDVLVSGHYSDQYLIGGNLIEYNGGIVGNTEKILGNLMNFTHEKARSVPEILNNQLFKDPSRGTWQYRFHEYRSKSYLPNRNQNNLATKFLVIRLLVQPKNNLIQFLDSFGWSSELYFEKIIKIN